MINELCGHETFSDKPVKDNLIKHVRLYPKKQFRTYHILVKGGLKKTLAIRSDCDFRFRGLMGFRVLGFRNSGL